MPKNHDRPQKKSLIYDFISKIQSRFHKSSELDAATMRRTEILSKDMTRLHGRDPKDPRAVTTRHAPKSAGSKLGDNARAENASPYVKTGSGPNMRRQWDQGLAVRMPLDSSAIVCAAFHFAKLFAEAWPKKIPYISKGG